MSFEGITISFWDILMCTYTPAGRMLEYNYFVTKKKKWRIVIIIYYISETCTSTRSGLVFVCKNVQEESSFYFLSSKKMLRVYCYFSHKFWNEWQRTNLKNIYMYWLCKTIGPYAKIPDGNKEQSWSKESKIFLTERWIKIEVHFKCPILST